MKGLMRSYTRPNTNKAISVNLQQRPLKLGYHSCSCIDNTPRAITNYVPNVSSLFFKPLEPDFNTLVLFSLKSMKLDPAYSYAC